MHLTRILRQGLDQFPFETGSVDVYEAYLRCLHQWNQTYNLTAIRDLEQMAIRHIFDSLAIAPMITGSEIVDVGSGAGLPGIPLALLYPEKKFTLLDSNGKKTRFLTQAKIELSIANVTIVQDRAEHFRELFDHVLCRAFAPLPELVNTCAHLLGPGGNLLAMKGATEEKLAADVPLRLVSRRELQVPMLAEPRFVCTLERRG